MSHRRERAAPPFCPHPKCAFHTHTTGSWRWVRFGSYTRTVRPYRVRRFRCEHCGHSFGEQTFRTTDWLKRPELPATVFRRINSCSGFRQSAAERLRVFLVWRNYLKWFSERRHDATPAMRAGVCDTH